MSEGGTITPPCSPPCGAQEVEMEEGELLDETQDLPDMSDIRYLGKMLIHGAVGMTIV